MATGVALLCLYVAVVEARRARAGRAQSRGWLVAFLAAAVLSTLGAIKGLDPPS